MFSTWFATPQQGAAMQLPRIALTDDTPDGRFSVISHGSGYIKFLVPNLRYMGTTTLPTEGKLTPSCMDSDSNMTAGMSFANPLPSNQVTGLRTAFDMRNLWTMSIFRLSETSTPAASSDDLIGFSHCEDYDQDSVWKSVHVVVSSDLGVTWTRPVPILTAQERQPENGVPAYNGGLGDMAVVWDSAKRRWVAFFQEVGMIGLGIAVSTHPRGASLSWSKWDPWNNLYSSGLMGSGYGHPDLACIPGSNPTLLYDMLEKTWIIVYHAWQGSLVWATSTDLDRWSAPQYLDELTSSGSLVYNYPSLVGNVSDTMTTQCTNILSYGKFPHGLSEAKFLVARTIQFRTSQPPIIGAPL